MDIASFLGTIDAFSSLDANSRQRLADRLEVREYQAEQHIIRRGEPGDCMYIIASGTVKVPILDESGKQRLIAQLAAGQFFGEMALLTGEPRNADVIAAEATSCVVIPKRTADALLKAFPDIAAFLTEILGERLTRVDGISRVGKYNLVGELGRGGMAIVYEGLHPSLDRPVAIKMLSHQLVYHAHFADRFRNEAKIIAGLRHPNIVEVYDGEEAYATFFIVMEKLTGLDIEKILDSRGSMTFDEVRDIVLSTASALDYAHTRGIIHRDVKPSNIVINRDGTVKLTDFGLALVPDLEEALQMQKGISLGTPIYMAPEQAMAKPLDGRADIYALGIVAYEMMCGDPPFLSDDPYKVMRMHIDMNVESPRKDNPKVPDDLNEFVLRACAKNPKDRFQTCREIVEFLTPERAPAPRPEDLGVKTLTFVYDKSNEAEVARIERETRAAAAKVRGVIVK